VIPFPSAILQGGVPIGTARRYLKIDLTDVSSATVNDTGVPYGIVELTLHETVGGPDVLAGSGATITASSTTGAQTTALLVDGNAATYWGSSSGVPQTLTIDWGAGLGKEIKEIGIRPRNDGNFQQMPSNGSVSYGPDNVSYTLDWNWPALFHTFTGGGVYGLMKTRRPPLIPNTGSNRRIWGIKGNACSAGFAETGKIELRATVGGSQIATGGGTALALSSWRSDFPPDLAFTGVGNQMDYASLARSYVAWDFGEGNEIAIPAQIALKASAIPSRCYTDFDLFYMPGNGQAPVVARNFTTPATWASGEVRTFNT
jgi:hypothetical protein